MCVPRSEQCPLSHTGPHYSSSLLTGAGIWPCVTLSVLECGSGALAEAGAGRDLHAEHSGCGTPAPLFAASMAT